MWQRGLDADKLPCAIQLLLSLSGSGVILGYCGYKVPAIVWWNQNILRQGEQKKPFSPLVSFESIMVIQSGE